jgi:hypothetical protein
MASGFSGVITSLLYRDLKKWPAYLLATFISFFYVLTLFPMHFFMGEAAFFQSGDIAQHISGWLAYAADVWRWPLLFTNRINYPDGVSIAFTDSIPLLAILLKPFVQFFPPGFHYFGIWQGISFFLQGIASVFLMRALGIRHVLSLVAALVFTLTWPSLIWRTAHTSLTTHWLILTALGLYFCGQSGRFSFLKITSSFFILCTLALLIHPYFVPFCFLIFSAYLIDISIKKESSVFNLAWAAALGLLIIGLGKVLGYLGGNTADGGFSQFSFNLAAPFCGGSFTPCFKDATGGQGEGFNYLGIGFLFLAVAGLAVYGKRAVLMLKEYPAIFTIALLLTFYALSNKIYFQNYLLAEYVLPEFARQLTSTFRASGRFFWMTGYLLLFVVLSIWLKQRERYVPLIVGVAMIIQIIDLQPLRRHLVEMVDRPLQVEDKRLSALLANIDEIKIYPVFGCANVPSDIYLQYQLLGTQYGKILNTAYMARSTPDCVGKSREFHESLARGALYVLPTEYLQRPQFMLPSGFVEALQQEKCVQLDLALVCLSDSSRSVRKYLGLEKAIPEYRLPRNSYRWAAAELPTQVGVPDAGRLFAREGAEGYMTFGPYVMLSAGVYKVSISYSSENDDLANPNTWDVMSNKGAKPGEFAKGVFIPTAGKNGKTIGTISLDQPTEAMEIRSFFRGKGRFRIDDVTVEKM